VVGGTDLDVERSQDESRNDVVTLLPRRPTVPGSKRFRRRVRGEGASTPRRGTLGSDTPRDRPTWWST